MTRVSIKITGAQGQGIDSIGSLCAKGLKRAGYCVFGYREYMSLIKGGHSSYQLDVSDRLIRSTEQLVDILVCFNHHGLEKNLHEVKPGGFVLHQTADWTFSAADQKALRKRRITVLQLPTDEIVSRLKAKPVIANVLITAVVWALLGQKKDALKALVAEQFGKKKELLALNLQCVDEGWAFLEGQTGLKSVALPAAQAVWKKQMLLTGSQAMGMGLVHAGVRLYAGYPMTPSSPLLSYIAEIQNETGMVIKQAEDEITAAQIVTGAMFAGTRAVTATSGGGFDLMTETVSLNGILENPAVFILAQRPGPATGLPTWTAQGDLFLAVYGGHGEFARCVLSVSDAQDCFDLMPAAFNLAEEYQTPVIVLTDKQIAEAIWTQQPFKQTAAKLRRGKLVTDARSLSRLSASDRYDPLAKHGISPRWLPGARAATYAAQGDEHGADGSVDESAANAVAQMRKRMKKRDALRDALPEPVLYGSSRPDVLLVGWGSIKGPVLDVLADEKLRGKSVAYLHYSYLWPLKTKLLRTLAGRARRTVIVEGNYGGQLATLLQQETGLRFPDRLMQYDGRPFFHDDLLARVLALRPR